ncbi:DUF6292 family protein [Lentzea sp. HUAS12]|uniref:DUF6292 family protein n=1 Tax=Lentzea sp. HUAS12 TaxID=2951806 RepID=UPI00209F553B|nr:DUF6292 family protein [Lentzea sp. HUAS12]USX54804.1 DUF6292 family protein [Lentzea sp. HUAS12]
MSVQTGFHFDSDDTARRLRRYVDDVLDAAGLSGYGYLDHVDGSWNAYVAVDGRVPGFPDHDVALLWAQDDGWSVAAENPADGSLVVIDRLAGPRQSPAAVARWVRSVLRRRPPQTGAQRRLVS